jgi:hypothetical protein
VKTAIVVPEEFEFHGQVKPWDDAYDAASSRVLIRAGHASLWSLRPSGTLPEKLPEKNVLVPRFFLLFSLLDVP